MNLKIASVQLDSKWQDTAANLQQLNSLIKETNLSDCDVLVLPELFHAGFSMAVDLVAEPQQGVIYQALSQLAKNHAIYIIAGVAQKTSGLESDIKILGAKALNTAVVFDRAGKEIACYVKNYTFTYAEEGDYYQAGNQSVAFELEGVSCSVFICYDLRFPELFRKVAKQVEVIFVIANWPESRQSHWETLLKARAIENQCFIVGVNRLGKDGNDLNYIGGSMVVDPLGDVLSYGQEADDVIMTEIDPLLVQQVRKQFPFLQDMLD